MKTAPAPDAPARPAPGAVPSAEPLHWPVDAAEDSLDGLQTAFGALSVEEVVAQPAKRKRESEKDAGDGADEGEEQGQDPTDVPTRRTKRFWPPCITLSHNHHTPSRRNIHFHNQPAYGRGHRLYWHASLPRLWYGPTYHCAP